MTGLGIVVVSLIVIFTALACFMLGWLARRKSDAELIGQLEAELDARQEICPAEVAHEPAQLALVQAADTAWDLPAIRLEGIDELDIWTATIIASTDRFLLELGIEPAR